MDAVEEQLKHFLTSPHRQQGDGEKGRARQTHFLTSSQKALNKEAGRHEWEHITSSCQEIMA